MTRTISTFPRFLYLNIYALLLLLVGGFIACIPLYKISLWLLIPQGIGFLFCLKNAHKIFASWKSKKRKYAILMERNEKELRPDTFKDYIQAPCGRLLVKIVLKDLNQENRYKDLLTMKQPLIQNCKESCTPKITTVYINEQYNPGKE